MLETVDLGPLQTQVKTCDRVVWSRILKCIVKSYFTGPSTKFYFDEFLFMSVLTHEELIKGHFTHETESHVTITLQAVSWK